jgi:hypothetical protein
MRLLCRKGNWVMEILFSVIGRLWCLNYLSEFAYIWGAYVYVFNLMVNFASCAFGSYFMFMLYYVDI